MVGERAAEAPAGGWEGLLATPGVTPLPRRLRLLSAPGVTPLPRRLRLLGAPGVTPLPRRLRLLGGALGGQ